MSVKGDELLFGACATEFKGGLIFSSSNQTQNRV
jgi:hypothetical protein